MFSSQNQNLPSDPTGANQEPLRTWKNWKHEHPEFNRARSSIVAFERKILIVGGHLESEDKRAINLILIDPESQKFQIIEPTGADAQFDCNSHMSACYWKDSQIVVSGGYNDNGVSSAVGVITFKDLNSENPSAHWEKIVPSTELFRFEHSAHIYEDIMYVFGGSGEDERRTHEIWCLDLTSATWEEFPSTCLNDNLCIEPPFVFHENKAYTSFWAYDSIQEIDLKSRSSKVFPIPPKPKKLPRFSFIESCPQLVDEKIFFLAYPGDQPTAQIWAFDLNLMDWVEIKTTQPGPKMLDRLLYCHNNLILSGISEESTDPFFCQLWSLPWKIPKTTSTTVLTKTQQALKDFFFEAPYSDISFEVGSEVIKAHKWWLIQRNKFFANMFSSGMAEAQVAKIKITDMKASTFKVLVQ